MAKINAKRLLKLADYLETVPRKKFDMSDWTNGKRGCGFAGCAIGWGIHGKILPKSAKLTMVRDLGGTRAHLTFRGETQMDAAALMMGIERDDASSLFGAHIKGTPKQIAERIRNFATNNEKASAE